MSLLSSREAAAASLLNSAWRYEEWLHTWPLNKSTVLDYFKHSDFYDRTCNNEIAIMQTMSADAMRSAHHAPGSAQHMLMPCSAARMLIEVVCILFYVLCCVLCVCVWCCSQLEGVEYSVDAPSGDDYFVIRKHWRADPSTVHLMALYYVVGIEPTDPLMPQRGTVFPMPDLHTVLKANLVSAPRPSRLAHA
jgi:hypothetical protein